MYIYMYSSICRLQNKEDVVEEVIPVRQLTRAFARARRIIRHVASKELKHIRKPAFRTYFL